MKLSQFKKVLITQGQLKNYAGSEIITIELAEFLAENGVQVTVLTDYAGEPIIKEFTKLKNVNIVITQSAQEKALKADSFDLIWVHHQLLTENLVNQIVKAKKRPFIVFHHMSSWVPMEFPILYDLENSLADVVLYNSQETKEEVNKLGIQFSTELVFGNPSPDSFYISRGVKKSNTINKIAVVSNHAPEEVYDASKILNKKGIVIDFIGRQNNSKPQRVTKGLLGDYDVVITIGKTVQYCILMNKAVYCYDWFGGPGYLNAENFHKSKELNFSGRGFKRISGQDLAKDIIKSFEAAKTELDKIHTSYSDEMLLSKKLQAVLSELSLQQRKTINISKANISAYGKYCELTKDLRSLKNIEGLLNSKIAGRDKTIVDLRNKVADLKESLDYSKKQIELIYSSRTFKTLHSAKSAIKKLDPRK